ncbi:Peroxidasin [Nymphon striatum]|nr:Peroxidasin [Nymphon striatum]
MEKCRMVMHARSQRGITILVLATLFGISSGQFLRSLGRRQRLKPLITSTSKQEITYRNGRSECALILQRTYTTRTTPAPEFGGFFDLVQDSSSHDFDVRARHFGFDDGSVTQSSDFRPASRFRYLDHFPTHARSSGRRFKRAVDDGRTEEICITYRHIDEAFHEASRYKDCRLRQSARNGHVSAEDIASTAECVLEITRLLRAKFDMSYSEITKALPLINVRKTEIYNICPSVQKPVPCTAEKYREMDGRCNNLRNPSWGTSMSPFIRLITPKYGDGISTLRKSIVNSEELPLPRIMSTYCHEDVNHVSSDLSQMFMAFGQVVDHDLTFSAPTLIDKKDFKCCGVKNQHPNCDTIRIPSNDIFHGPSSRTCMEFKRSLAGHNEGCTLGPRNHINAASAIIDTSFVYGTNQKMMAALRTFHRGLLATNLPEEFKDRRLKPLLPPKTKLPDKGCIGRSKTNGLYCFMAGLKQGEFTAATFQHITYNEYLPETLGSDLMRQYDLELSSDFWDGYDDTMNQGIATSFMSAAFRFSHSNIDNKIDRYNKHHQRTASQNLREFFRNPFAMYGPGAADEFLIGMVNQPIQQTDPFMGEEVTNHLFQKPLKTFGIDLSATNIKRGRDHGLPGYNSFRKFCGLPVARTFQELAPLLQNKTAQFFSNIYKHVDDIDLWSAGIAENRLPGAQVGPTFGCLIGLQFKSIRKGDRFWYENPDWPSSFRYWFVYIPIFSEQLREIKKTSMAKVLCDNGDDIETIQYYTMRLAHPSKFVSYKYFHFK